MKLANPPKSTDTPLNAPDRCGLWRWTDKENNVRSVEVSIAQVGFVCTYYERNEAGELKEFRMGDEPSDVLPWTGSWRLLEQRWSRQVIPRRSAQFPWQGLSEEERAMDSRHK